MNSKELRIGNWFINYEAKPEKTIYWQVEEICSYTKKTGIGVMYRNGSSWTSEPQPAPLTEDWLLRFGFEKKKHITRNWDEDCFVLSVENYAWDLQVVLGDYDDTNPNCGQLSIRLEEELVSAIPEDLIHKENWTKEDEERAANFTIKEEAWMQPIAYYLNKVHRLQNVVRALTGKELELKTDIQ